MNINDFIRKEDGKIVIPVPPGIRYMSQWADFNLSFFGNQPFIIDKQIPGCGFTEYCLTNDDNIVLISPRKLLLENKFNQHPNEIYYFENKCDDSYTVDTDLTKQHGRGDKKSTSEEDSNKDEEEPKKNNKKLLKMESKLNSYLNDMDSLRKPYKIIVTYDSFKHLKRYLVRTQRLENFRIVVDEFQSIFVDSRFKATTEFSFLIELRNISGQICFVSATPMMDTYLKQVEYFNGLPYFELDWGLMDKSRVMKPELKVRKIVSVNSEIKRIIREYKSGKFAVLSNPENEKEIIQSREAVFYVNSVNNILSVIKSEGLKPEEVNILCSNTNDNIQRIKKRLGEKFIIVEGEGEDKVEKAGFVPLRGQPHKMFTFCTRTVYLGADFYSTNARTFILSDANIDSLAVDISLDLPQILGRQRLESNPWKNHAEFYFKNLGSGKGILKDEFNKLVDRKVEETNHLLTVLNKADPEERTALIRKYKKDIVFSNYKDDYLSINISYNESPVPVFNNLVYIAELRAFDIQQVDYKDRFTVFSTLKLGSEVEFDKMTRYIDMLREDTSKSIPDRLRMLCETKEFTDDEKKVIAHQVSEKFDKFYNILGPDRCKANGYKTSDLIKEINILTSRDNILQEFESVFVIGNRYSNKDIKLYLTNIYSRLGLYKTPKTTDLNEFFEVKKVQIFSSDRSSKENGLEILRLK